MLKKEINYLCIIVATLLHGLITYLELGSMPYISLLNINKVAIIAFLIWMFYGITLGYVTQTWIVNETISYKRYLKSIVFGIVVALGKGILDLVTSLITQNIESAMVLAVIIGSLTMIFGAVIMIAVVFLFARKKVDFTFSKIVKKGAMVLLGIVMIYIIIIGNYFRQNQQAILRFDATLEEIQNLDYHFAFKILNGNIIMYVLFYIVFWFCLNVGLCAKTLPVEE